MKLSLFDSSHTQEVIELCTQVFSISDGEAEGQLVGGLVADLIAMTPPQNLIGCVAISNERIVGNIFFSHFIVPNSQLGFILAPVAVATNVQRTGIGQQLINYGLNYLKSLNVDLVFTYGDPAYYPKMGFRHITENVVKAPYELSLPHGWLAQSLDGNPIKPMQGVTQCVKALSNPKYW